jgi:hypothetical protein
MLIVVLFGMQGRALGPYSAAINRILTCTMRSQARCRKSNHVK